MMRTGAGLRGGRLHREPSGAAAEARGLLGARRRPEVSGLRRHRGGRLRGRRPARSGLLPRRWSIAASTRSISWRPTWAGRATSSPASMTRTSCTTRRRSTSTWSRPAGKRNIRGVFYSSSACIYPAYNQEDPDNPICSEDSAYPAAPDSEYGWEKLFCERLYLAFNRNHGMENRVARYHNIFGPEGTWRRRQREGAGGDLPQGGDGGGARRDRDLGGRAARRGRSSTSTSAWRGRCGWRGRTSPGRSTSGRRRW